jgi:hypothetical protein
MTMKIITLKRLWATTIEAIRRILIYLNADIRKMEILKLIA